MSNETRIPYTELESVFTQILLKNGYNKRKAALSSSLFSKASLDGVASHGANRFLPYLEMIRKGYVNVDANPELDFSIAVFEKWDGQKAPGDLNAHYSMGRAIHLAKENGMGCIALRNTNHWMRAGNYGWQAVENGCIGICFTNTKPNMPAWGGSEPILGNNPLVVGIPRKDGPVVLDMAMTQFSYGKMEQFMRDRQQMSFPAGFDKEGNLTKDPSSVLENELALPAGLWKGAGLSLVLDIMASVLSDGNATHEIGEFDEEHSISQVFFSLYLPKLGISKDPDETIDKIINNLKSSSVFDADEVRYPGENSYQARRYNLENGVPIDEEIWKQIKNELA